MWTFKGALGCIGGNWRSYTRAIKTYLREPAKCMARARADACVGVCVRTVCGIKMLLRVACVFFCARVRVRVRMYVCMWRQRCRLRKGTALGEQGVRVPVCCPLLLAVCRVVEALLRRARWGSTPGLAANGSNRGEEHVGIAPRE